MSKSEVYSWRIDPDLKDVLERAARAENGSVAQLLERIVSEWLEGDAASGDDEEVQRSLQSGDDEEVQRSLHKTANACFGTLRGGDPDLAERAGERARAKIQERHAGSRAG